MTTTETTKTCSFCEETKPLTEYHRLQSSRDGHGRACKDCNRTMSREAMRKTNSKKLAPVPIVYGIFSNSLQRYIYVGRTRYQLDHRRAQHVNQANSNAKRDIHKAILDLGVADLEWNVLQRTTDPVAEERWVKKLGTHLHGYNSTESGR